MSRSVCPCPNQGHIINLIIGHEFFMLFFLSFDTRASFSNVCEWRFWVPCTCFHPTPMNVWMSKELQSNIKKKIWRCLAGLAHCLKSISIARVFRTFAPSRQKKDYNIHERQKKRIFVMWVGSRSSEWTTFKVGGSYIFRVFHKCSAYTIIWNFSSTASLFDITAFNEQKWTNDRRRFAAKFLMWIFTSVQQVISSAPSPCDCASHFIIAFEMCRECQWQTEEKNFVCVPRAPFKCSPHEPSLKKFCKLCEYNK